MDFRKQKREWALSVFLVYLVTCSKALLAPYSRWNDFGYVAVR